METKRIQIFGVLCLVLFAVVFSPSIRGWVASSLRAKIFTVGTSEIAVPKGWLVSQEAGKLSAWKPCVTVFCGVPSQASFLIKTSTLPEPEWENSSKKTIHDQGYPEVSVTHVESRDGSFVCVEAQGLVQNSKSITSCLSPELSLTSTFLGDPALKNVHFSVLRSARRVMVLR